VISSNAGSSITAVSIKGKSALERVLPPSSTVMWLVVAGGKML
jgi:hypothetical protein